MKQHKLIAAVATLLIAGQALALDVGKSAKVSPTVADLQTTPALSIPAIGQFRINQIITWCAQSPECLAKMQAALADKTGPWADVCDDLTHALDNPDAIKAQEQSAVLR